MNNFALIQLLFLSLILSVFTEADYFPDKNNWAVSSPEAEGTSTGKVNKLIDLAFADSATQGVVVIKNGKIIGEKYTDGYSSLSHGTSWSMAKSYYAALIGISIDRGEIGSLDDKVSKYLNYYDDERSNITIRDLLNCLVVLNFQVMNMKECFFKWIILNMPKKSKLI